MDGLNILITGGTGTFGNAFSRYVLDNYRPKKLIVFSRDEYKQYNMDMELSKHKNSECIRYFVGDVRDEGRLEFALRDVDIVFHAAAMKQVVTAEYNPIECIKTNIVGAENLIRAAISANVPKVFAISTDKAVKPINLYGASKACMERLFIAANHLSGADGTKFACARYGNVVGSRGSVIPLFKKMRETGKLTITDERMSRFWLTIEKGAAFVDRSARIMYGGEVFVSRTPSMKVTDLATAMAPECDIEYVGIRPGEKLYEDLISTEEGIRTLEFDDFYIIQPNIKIWDDENPTNYDGIEGTSVPANFCYHSDNNSEWLDETQLTAIINSTEVIS